MRTITAYLLLALLSALKGANPGKIVGSISCDGAAASVVVWAVTSDCRTSYRTTEFDNNRFTLEAIPPAKYRLVGYCGPAFALPAPEVQVEPGMTAHVDLNAFVQANSSGQISPGVAPLNGRIVDGGGRPVSGVSVSGQGVQLWPKQETVSGPDGRFGFCAARLGPATLTLKRAGYRPRRLKLSIGILNYSNGQLEIKLRKQ